MQCHKLTEQPTCNLDFHVFIQGMYKLMFHFTEKFDIFSHYYFTGFMPYYFKDVAYVKDPKLFDPDRPIRPHRF